MYSQSLTNTGLRVLAVIPGDGRGNTFIFARRQVQSLAKLGVNVRVFYLKSRSSPQRLLTELRKLRQDIREFRPHLLHAHYGTVTSFICAFGTSVPLVVTFRGSDLSPHPTFSFLRGYLSLALSQLSIVRASKVICVSQCTMDKMWWGGGRTVILPSGVNLSLFHPCPRDEARTRLGWNTHDRIILFSAGVEPKAKGIDLVKEAINIAEAIIGPVRLAILDGTVPPEEIPVYMNASDCLAVASHSEGSPNIVKEALACNLPVVTVDVGDVQERLAGESLSTVVSRDPQEFGEALAEILASKKRSKGRDLILNLSEELVDCGILRVYEDVLRFSRSGWRERVLKFLGT